MRMWGLSVASLPQDDNGVTIEVMGAVTPWTSGEQSATGASSAFPTSEPR